MTNATRLVKDGDEFVLPLSDELVQLLAIELGDELHIVTIENGQLILRQEKNAATESAADG